MNISRIGKNDMSNFKLNKVFKHLIVSGILLNSSYVLAFNPATTVNFASGENNASLLEKQFSDLSTSERRQAMLDALLPKPIQNLLITYNAIDEADRDLMPIMYTPEDILNNVGTSNDPTENEYSLKNYTKFKIEQERLLNPNTPASELLTLISDDLNTIVHHAYSVEQLNAMWGKEPVYNADVVRNVENVAKYIDEFLDWKETKPEEYNTWVNTLSPAGPDTAGETPAGPDTAGETPAGPDTAGETPAGPDTAGETPAGPDTAGETPAEPDTAVDVATVPVPNEYTSMYADQVMNLPDLFNNHYIERYQNSQLAYNHQTFGKITYGKHLVEQINNSHYTHVLVGQDFSPIDENTFIGGYFQYIKGHAQGNNTSGESDGYALSLYGGLHSVKSTRVFIDGVLTLGQLNHKYNSQRYHQKFIEGSIEVGYRYKEGNFDIVPSVQVGMRAYQNTSPVAVQVDNQSYVLQLEDKKKFFVDAQVKAGYLFKTGFADFEPNIVLGYRKNFNNNLLIGTQRTEFDGQRYIAQAGLNMYKANFTARFISKYELNSNSKLVDKNIGLQLQYQF
ncbi:hypothetical protein JP35_11480 [Gallibacterium anatis]|nr:hypothetical protein JP35_11480 [Gallibacterium anatis]